jgi:hypothetical protein
MRDDLRKILMLEIRNTKNLKNLDLKYVEQKLDKFILTYGDVYKKLRMLAEKKGLSGIDKSKPFKEVVKRVRDELRIVYGSFLTEDFHKKRMPADKDEIVEVLKTHKSTKERIEFYDEIYSKIIEWHKPKKIADLGCGLNPLSYFFMNLDCDYFASDLSSADMNFIQCFFNEFQINGRAKAYDLTNLSILEDDCFQKCDLVFLFKVLDSLEEVKKNVSKDLLQGISAKHIVVSFPTKSLLSKKGFRIEKRNWLFNFINKMGWKHERFEVENELFVLIDKS